MNIKSGCTLEEQKCADSLELKLYNNFKDDLMIMTNNLNYCFVITYHPKFRTQS